MEFQNDRAEARARLCALDKDYKILLDALGFESASFDVLVTRTGFPSQSVASMLLILELEGAVGLQAGGQYVRLLQSDHG
jgi:DNA processing protein